MPIYTVHSPLSRDDTRPQADDIAFVRDGFSWTALVFGPFWLLWHRLWWALLGYMLLTLVVTFAMARLGLSANARVVVWSLLAFLMGLEAASLRRWTLSRGRWRQLGLIAADDRDGAEQRFFAHWTPAPRAAEPYDRGAPPPARPAAFHTPPQGDIIGLFPQPGGAPR